MYAYYATCYCVIKTHPHPTPPLTNQFLIPLIRKEVGRESLWQRNEHVPLVNHLQDNAIPQEKMDALHTQVSKNQ
ncbi:unnamed protein product [Orchesella dallaii]|uniref:Uncharacterized protein n=1 Tax=Orchesella dallaii TaxID=48710 RepID=A0ABP1QG51_9HEXA